MPHPVTLANLKIGREAITIVVTWPKQPLDLGAEIPGIAAPLTRVISSASMELSRIKAGTRTG
jgi:hypothetical protein